MRLIRGFDIPGVIAFVEYGAIIVRDFDDGDQCFMERSLYYCFEVTWALPS
jgi:hypothetical protein